MTENATLLKPFIGVLCMDRKDEMAKDQKSYIDNKYIEYLEVGGAEVVPIWINKDQEYYEYILNKVNGVLIPGGAVFVNEHDPTRLELTNYCVRATDIIINIAKRKYDQGNYLPLWGTCLGLQLLVLYTTNMCHTDYGTDPRERCEYMNCYLPVEFTPDFRKSHLFRNLPAELESAMRNEPFGPHRHKYCLSIQSCKSFNDDWHVLAKNTDGTKEFATFMEHRKYPFYGSQIHTESADEPVRKYLAKWFVDECRRCSNRFKNAKEARRHLIQNFAVVRETKGHDDNFVRVFGEAPDYPQ